MSFPRFPFPRPDHPSQVVVPAAGGTLDGAELFRLLTDSGAHEAWTQLSEHSHSIRLLVSRGWVFKTRPDDLIERLDRTLEILDALAARTARLGVWHPAKTWFALRLRDGYLPCNACPRLLTLGDLPGWPSRLGLRLRLLVHQRRLVRQAVARGCLLDFQPQNFGYDAAEQRFYYIDDEVYSLTLHLQTFS